MFAIVRYPKNDVGGERDRYRCEGWIVGRNYFRLGILGRNSQQGKEIELKEH